MSGEANRNRPLHLVVWLMLGALVGKVLGFAREIEMARLLGASYIADSFRASITATILPIAVLQGDIVPSVLIPMHREWSSDGRAPLRFTLLTIILGLVSLPITLAVFMLTDQWVGILVAGFAPEAHALTVRFVRVMTLSMPASVIMSCLSCIEISVGRARITTIRASVQNVAIMGGIALMALTGDVLLIGWAFTLSTLATTLYGGIMLLRERELTLRGASLSEAGQVVMIFARRVRMLLVTPFAEQGNTLFERMLVSRIGVGAVASMEYARTLTETALFLISQPIGFVVLAQAGGDREDTRSRVEALLRPLLAVSLPAALFIIVFAADIVTVVLRRGAFQDHAVELTSSALCGLASGLWAAMIGSVLIRMLNARHRNRTAALILLIGAAGQALVNLLAVPRLGVLGAGLGDSTRGLVMLVGSACMLSIGPLLLRLLLIMLPPAIGFIAMGKGVSQLVDLPIARLILGGAGFGVGIVLCLLLLAPDFSRMAATRLTPFRLRAKL